MIQLQFLNKILSSRDASLIELNNLTSDYFCEYKAEFEFIKSHLDLYHNVPDLPTFLSHFKDFEVIEVLESDEYLIKALVDDYNARRMSDTFNAIKPLVISGQIDKAIDLYKRMGESLNKGVSMKTVDLLHDTSRYDRYLDKTGNVSKYYISTGFKELDEVIGGFDRQEELATIVARTNYGKSWVLLKCATSACEQGLRVGLYSGEMSADKVGYRADTLIGHISNGALTHGNVEYQVEYKRYIDSLQSRFPNAVLKVLTPDSINGPADVNALKVFMEKESLDILFIDQLSLLEDMRRGRNDFEKAGNIIKDLKNLQVMKHIPIICVSQQNRTESEKGVDTTQIANSDKIGQYSTVVIFIEKKDYVMKLTLVKSRDSENGKVLTYNVDLNKGDFVFIPTGDDCIKGKIVKEDYEKRYEPQRNDVEDYF